MVEALQTADSGETPNSTFPKVQMNSSRAAAAAAAHTG